MKNNAIARIILFSISIFLLLSILLAGLFYDIFRAAYHSGSEVTHIAVPVSGATVNANEVHELHIEWAAGNIEIIPFDGASDILMRESEPENDADKMVYIQSGDKLIIQFRKETSSGFGIHINEDISKNLEIFVPSDWICEKLEIDAAAANVTIRQMTLHNVDFDGASGLCIFEDCAIDELDVDAASGDLRFTGTLDKLDFDGMSASCYLVLKNEPSSIDMDSMSGDLDVTLPEYCGFTVSMDAMSSDFHSDFPTSGTKGTYVYGDGHCRINLDAMTGDVTIRKGAEATFANGNS